MKKQVVTIKSGTRKDPVYTEETLLAHNGLAVRKARKGRYTITHVRTGYGINNLKELSYKQARAFVVEADTGFNWDRELEEITKDPTFVPFVVEMYRKVQGNV